MKTAVEQAAGTALVLLVLLDIFLTVLYARMNAGIIGHGFARIAWRFSLWISRWMGTRRFSFLSYCGPLILVCGVAVWALSLTLGTALIFHPELGSAIRMVDGPTPRDFLTAMYAAGSSVAIIGSNDFAPRTPLFRGLFLINSLIGMSVMTLTLTYLLQIYNALQRRNSTALRVNLLTCQSGDAAELIASVGPAGKFDFSYSHLADIANGIADSKEAHHFYPVLFYFRFREPHYATARFTLVALDAVSLIRSALADDRYAWLKQSAGVSQLWQSSVLLLTTLEQTFVPGGVPDSGNWPDPATRERWRARYLAAADRLDSAGIETTRNERAGIETYISLRSHWEPLITAMANIMAFAPYEIDPAGSDPALSGKSARAGDAKLKPIVCRDQ